MSYITTTNLFRAGALALLLTLTATATGEAATCGNRILEAGEECDGPEPAGVTCADLGYDTGWVACTDQCLFYREECYFTTIPSLPGTMVSQGSSG